MTFAREKRVLLGLLAAISPLPLVFNDVLETYYIVAFEVGVAVFFRRAWAGHEGWLPPWVMNLLGLAYLPYFLFDLTVLNRGGMVTPMVHLGLFLVLVKLFSLRREVDKWQTMVAIFFLFLAAMATSVHPSIVIYLISFGVFTSYLLARFAHLHLIAGFGGPAAEAVKVPFAGFITLSLLLTTILAVPLFALLPRVRTPYIFARGVGTGTQIEAMGFSDEVTLDSIGAVRDNRRVALRLSFYDEARHEVEQRESFRFKAGTFDTYSDGRWKKSPYLDTLLAPHPGAAIELAEEKPNRWAKIYQRPLATRSLAVPVEAVRLKAKVTSLHLGSGGSLDVRFRPQDVFEYEAGLAPRAVNLGPAPDFDRATGPLDQTGLSPRMADLAAEVMGEGHPEERALRLERHLAEQFEYTLDFVGRSKEDSLESFLFKYKSGHCEYFASAMVLLLRSQGIPARLVTGFLGAEYNPLEGYFIVRQGNAHAWVEAFIEDPAAGLAVGDSGRGSRAGEWRIFDPTPSIGRPAPARSDFMSLISQTYDYLIFRWDRYVLTFGFGDQLELVSRLRDLWSSVWAGLRRPAPPSVETETAIAPAQDPAEPADKARISALDFGKRLILPVLLVVLILMAVLIARQRRPLTATLAYRRLRRRLSRVGMKIGPADPPAALRDSATERYPEAARPTARVVDLYLQESFAQRALEERQQEELTEALGEALQRLRKAG